MSFFATLNQETRRRNLAFLVIGGLAVNLHGCSRDTADLDLLVLREAREAWIELLTGLGYTLSHDGGPFLQFDPPKAGAWPVDLMLVNATTFSAMATSALETDIYGERMRIPSLEHLIALKLHALKHSHLGRFLKDFMDVQELVRVNGLKVRSESFKSLVLKYGTVELYEKIVHACEHGG
jgi:predicted nucleotidyltransferase